MTARSSCDAHVDDTLEQAPARGPPLLIIMSRGRGSPIPIGLRNENSLWLPARGFLSSYFGYLGWRLRMAFAISVAACLRRVL